MSQIDWSLTISIVAAGISLGSLAVTIWATRISKRSLDHAIDVQESLDQKEFDRLRADLLMQIADDRRILDKARIEIGTIKANFDAEPQAVRMMLANYTNLFSHYLPDVEGAIRQLDKLWQDVSAWTNDKKHDDFMNAKAVLYRSLKDDEIVYDSAIYLVNVFKTKLEVAKASVDHGA